MRLFTFSRAVSCCALLSFTAIFTMPAEVSWAGVFADKPDYGSEEVEFFAAIDAKEIDATMVPNDSRKVTLQIKNNTERPLAIRLPHAFAGVPVLAQFGLPPLGGPGGGGGGGSSQALGMGFPGGGGGGGNPFGGPGGIMNVPPGKVITVKRKSVCLEHGKPDPGPRIPYQIVPLETVSDDASLAEMLFVLGHDELDQRVAQIVAWRLANDMSWEELAGLTIKHLNGRRTPRFTTAEIRAAMQFTAALPSQQEDKERSPPSSLSQR